MGQECVADAACRAGVRDAGPDRRRRALPAPRGRVGLPVISSAGARWAHRGAEIKITPNCPDALGIRGTARDLAARGLGSLKPLEIAPVPGSFDYRIGQGEALLHARIAGLDHVAGCSRGWYGRRPLTPWTAWPPVLVFTRPASGDPGVKHRKARRQVIASKPVKEIARPGGDVARFVTPAVNEALRARLWGRAESGPARGGPRDRAGGPGRAAACGPLGWGCRRRAGRPRPRRSTPAPRGGTARATPRRGIWHWRARYPRA